MALLFAAMGVFDPFFTQTSIHFQGTATLFLPDNALIPSVLQAEVRKIATENSNRR